MTTEPMRAPGRPRVLLHALAKNCGSSCCAEFAPSCSVCSRLPGQDTVVTLVVLYGAFALVDGVLAVAAAISGGAPASRWWLAIVGLAGIAAGLLTFLWPGVTALVLLIFIAIWAIVTGVLQIVGAIQLRKEIDNEWLLIASGVLSVLFGLAVPGQVPARSP